MGRIILVRHGQTNRNAVGEIHTVDDPEVLNGVGIEQIKKAAKKVKEFSPVKIYTSKTKRAVDSAELMSKLLGLKLETVSGIEERNWGDLAGQKWDNIEKILQSMTAEERYLYLPPNGETWQDCEGRLIKAINDLALKNENETILVVTHSGVIRMLMPCLLGVPREESYKYSPDNASLTIFDHNNGKFSLVSYNNTEHLK